MLESELAGGEIQDEAKVSGSSAVESDDRGKNELELGLEQILSRKLWE